MTPAQNEELRRTAAVYLAERFPAAMGSSAVLAHVRSQGMRQATAEDVAAALKFLEGTDPPSILTVPSRLGASAGHQATNTLLLSYERGEL